MTPGERAAFLTAKTEAYTDKMMKRWDKLAKFLSGRASRPRRAHL